MSIRAKKHPFSIEVNDRNHVKEMSIREGTKGALIEGELGEHIEIEAVEGILLLITGDGGVFRLDLNEGDYELLEKAATRGQRATIT